jgi:hypothetical protein
MENAMRTNELGYRLGNEPVATPKAAERYFTNSLVGDVSVLITALAGKLGQRKTARRSRTAKIAASRRAFPRYY